MTKTYICFLFFLKVKSLVEKPDSLIRQFTRDNTVSALNALIHSCHEALNIYSCFIYL